MSPSFLQVMAGAGGLVLLLVLWYMIARLSTAAYFRSKRDYMMALFEKKKEK